MEQSPAPRPRSDYDRAVMADRPSFYWPLDERSGPVRDLTGQAGPSTETTGALGVPGVSGTGVRFGSGTQRILVPGVAVPPDGSFSVEMWLKLSDVTGRDTGILSVGGGITVSVSGTGSRRIRLAGNGTDLRSYRGVLGDRYRQLVFTYDAGSRRWRWYVDGTPDAGGALPSEAGHPWAGAGLRLGEMAGVTVDAVSIYPKPLPSRRVGAHYTAAAGPEPKDRYVGGVALGGLQPWNRRRSADFAAMRRANVTWLRSDLGWQYLEPAPGKWNWRPFDDVIRDATAAGLNYLAILHTVPGWANGGGGDYAPPGDPARLTDYCYRTTRHYIPLGVTDYQIGNEVNLPHPGWSAPDGATYARRYLVPCVTGLRRAERELKVTVNVVLGSLAPRDWTGGADPVRFLTAVYRSGGRGYFDSAAWHPYTGADGPRVGRQMVSDPRRLHAVMAAQGDAALPIWATEFGYPTGGSRAVSERRQAAYVGPALRTWYSQSFAGPLFWYSGRDTGTAADREQHFGLLRHDGSAKPAYEEVAARFTR
ncbi:MAG TPA: LamG-like jellyroll fold domain-containing protein [Actinoplanes sp.]